ncbi:MAG TPA: O-antigen ligase family protein, partial [Tepidisphaeraceae bacterium]|nr:O-antigen ligase family protein [Tepidisphaeraceae bacterium]
MTTARITSRPVGETLSVTRPSIADRYLTGLCLMLLGYAVLGRGFAYLFVGELALGVGFLVIICTPGWTRIFQVPQLLLLLPFWAWGLARTIPYLRLYRADAVRDAMLWGYSGFAVIIAALILTDPGRLLTLLRRYRTFAYFFLALIPLVMAVFRGARQLLPVWPWAGVPVIHEKEGDIMVHLACIFAFWISGLPGKIKPLWLILLTVNVAAAGMIDRAGLLAFLMVVALCAACKPRHSIIWKTCVVAVLAVFVLWATNVHIPVPGGKGRDISFEQIVTNMQSMTGDTGADGLDSTKEWRVEWWHAIEKYTFFGPYRWTGKGFGVNLADDDGDFQVLRDNSLRAPHSAHMDFLAREGVPGLALWIVLQLAWVGTMASGYYSARVNGDSRWEAVFLFLISCWAAFIINSSFDVFFEGPMGGIWFWTVFGVGAAA